MYKTGDRVRIKYCVRYPEINGTEGTIVARRGNYFSAHQLRVIYDAFLVSVDVWGSPEHPDGTFRFCPAAAQLEPLIPPENYAADILAKKNLQDFKIATKEYSHDSTR